jgi:hypothetical protein
MTGQIQILVAPQRVIGYHSGVPVPSLCRRTSTAEREIEHVTEHHARQCGLAQADCAANRRMVRLQTCAPPRYHDHANTSWHRSRHATTPLLGEATNPIDATIANAVAWLCPERGREPL